MNVEWLQSQFDLTGQTAVVTGGYGVLCSAIARGLARAGVRVAVLGRDLEKAQGVVRQIEVEGGQAIAARCDVLDKSSLLEAADQVLGEFGKIDILINGAGGNTPQATTSPELSFFDLSVDALSGVFDLNMLGTLLPSQVFGRPMAEAGRGSIINISSMSAYRALTRVAVYSAAKAGVSNFTQWLAVHMAQEYSPAIRVNAIAPGYFLTEQNRFLLTDIQTGELTKRGKAIMAHTPMNRFGDPDELISAVIWLVSPGASFVTGVVIPIDGGVQAYSGI